jgi:hypothetical protein
LVLVATGCAAASTSTPTQTRCLGQGPPTPRTDSSDTFSTRPLVFFLCIQSP